MSTAISDVEQPTNNVVVRSRVPAENIRTGLPQPSRPRSTREKYVVWHPGCKKVPVLKPKETEETNSAFTFPKAPGLRLKNPVVTKLIGQRVKLARAKNDAGKKGKSSAPIRLSRHHPWLTVDAVFGAGVGILVVALLITILTSAIR